MKSLTSDWITSRYQERPCDLGGGHLNTTFGDIGMFGCMRDLCTYMLYITCSTLASF